MNRKHEAHIGIIGAGMIGKEHLRGFDVAPRCKVVAVAEADPDRLKRVTADHSIPLSFSHYNDLLAEDSIDGVVICTPPFTHEEIVLAALRQGKHVLCEKPLATTVAGAQRIQKQAKRSNRHVGSCSGRFRFSPPVLKAREIIDAGDLGDAYHIRLSGILRRNRPGLDYHTSATWNLSREKSGGGALIDWGIYDLNILFALFPELVVERVDGFCFRGIDSPHVTDVVFDVEEHGGALLRCSNGVTVSWERSWAAHMNRKPCVRIYGSHAGLAFNPIVWSKDDFFEIYEDRSGKPVTIAPDTAFDRWNVHISLAVDFVESILKNRPMTTTIEDDLKCLKVIHAVYKSNQKKTVVSV